jgi:two-component system response regulator AtoC
MGPPRVLLINGEPRLGERITTALSAIDACRMENAASLEAGLRRAVDGEVDVLLPCLSSRIDEKQVSWLLREMANRQCTLPVIAISDEDDPDLRLRLIQLGAVDCLVRPLDLSRLAFLVEFVTVRLRCLPCAVTPPARTDEQGSGVDAFLAQTPAMRRLMEKVHTVAPFDCTVLLLGETGTGKSHLGRLIHSLSPRKSSPFLVIQCGVLSATLIESELFGHARGAFTGADRAHSGRLAAAGAGTVLLDDIDAVPLETQPKLLRVVEDRMFEPLGTTRAESIQARLIATTNGNLDEMVAAGRFRADLYHRLNVVTLTLPPLREQPEAIPELARKLLGNFCPGANRPIPDLSCEAMRALQAYPWPGNVRELRNALAQAAIFCRRSRIEVADLPEVVCRSGNSRSLVPVQDDGNGNNKLHAARKEGEQVGLRAALERHGNNRTKAAEELGVSRVTLYKKLREYRLM